MTVTNIPYFTQVSHIHVQAQNQIMSNNLDCNYHSRAPVFLFFLPLFCSGVIVYLGSHRMVCTVDLGMVISFLLVFLLLLFLLLCFMSISIPIFFLRVFCFHVWGRLHTDGTLWPPSTQFF